MIEVANLCSYTNCGPSPSELNEYLELTTDPQLYRQVYQDIYTLNPKWLELQAPSGKTYQWDPTSTYIQKAPYFENFTMEPTLPKDIRGARCLAILGDSITTDHISPAGTIKKAPLLANFSSNVECPRMNSTATVQDEVIMR